MVGVVANEFSGDYLRKMELYPKGNRKKFKGISGIVPNEFSFIELSLIGNRKKVTGISYVKLKVSSSLLIPYIFEENSFIKLKVVSNLGGNCYFTAESKNEQNNRRKQRQQNKSN